MTQLDPDTLEHLAGGGLLLTANRRQSRFLLARHAEAMLATGRSVWTTPDIVPMDAWLADAFREAAVAGRAPVRCLLDEQAALWLWREAIIQDAPATLQDPADLAGLARRAWLALRLHGGDLAQLVASSPAGDQRLLLCWARRVDAKLAELDALDCGLLRLHASALLDERASGAVMTCGFDATTPGLTAMHAAFATRGRLRAPGWHGQSAVVRGSAAVDPDAELDGALEWLRNRLRLDPGGHYGLIVPDLHSSRADVERRLMSALQPSLELPGTLDHERVFDIAGGEALAAQGVVATALDLLGLGPGPVPFERVTRLLRSRFLADSDREAGSRAMLDVRMRRERRGAGSLAELAALARGGGCPQWAALVETHAAVIDSFAGNATLDVHMRRVGEVLQSWGWPGPDANTSDVHQAAQEWQARLRSLAALGAWAGSLDRDTAIGELRRLCQAPFQPERGLPRVLVLDTLDDVGVPLDGLRVLGLNADRWPRPSAPEPLLPVDLQRALGMAAATPLGRLGQAQRIQAAWRNSSRELILSWPRRRDDAKAVPSWLMPPYTPESEVGTVPVRRAVQSFETRYLEFQSADVALPLDPAQARGGARLPELQALCPFRAFAELRLGATAIEEPEPGIPATLRGQLLHEALRRLWNEFGDSRTLRALDPASRHERLRHVVTQAAASCELARFGRRAAELELEWQRAAVAHQLESDLRRGDFEVVATEAGYAATFGGLSLELRIDRVDRVDGRLLLIDYKTSRTGAARHWAGDRPVAPQLPLYALTHAPEVAGIAFAVVARDGARYSGVAADGAVLGPAADVRRFVRDEAGWRPADWQELRARWHAVLSRLVAEHAAGEAAVDPKGSQTCRHCHLMPLCRIRRKAAEDVDDDPSSAQAEDDG